MRGGKALVGKTVLKMFPNSLASTKDFIKKSQHSERLRRKAAAQKVGRSGGSRELLVWWGWKRPVDAVLDRLVAQAPIAVGEGRKEVQR